MTNIKNLKWALLISLTIILSFTVGSINTSTHDPRFIDLKYYDEDQILSVYITHGVSDSEYHYVERVTIEFYELPAELIENFTTQEKFILKSDEVEEHELFGDLAIREADVFDNVDVRTLNKTLVKNETYTSQVDDLINHYNYTIDAPEWTLIVVTAFCSLVGAYTHSLISGHPWYDTEHSMIEAVVPTLVCTVVVMTPLALWRIFGKKKSRK